MTSPSEADVLAQLRKTTLAYLSNADFAEVEKAVERDGILSLRGSAAALVKDAVRKHGSHDQSRHNPSKGGGGAGGNNPLGFGPQVSVGRVASDSFSNNVKQGDQFEAELKTGASVRGVATSDAKLRSKTPTSKPEPSVKYQPAISEPRGSERVLFDSDIKEVTVLTKKSTEINLQKHGSHDQSRHNPKKGGGGAGGGGGSSSPSTLGDTHKQELATAERSVRGAASSAAARGGGLKDPYIGPPTKAAVSAADSINAARSAKTVEEASGHIEIAKGELTQAFEQYENENFHDAAKVMFDTRKNLTTIMSAAKRGTSVTPALDMIDLTFPGGTFGD